MSLIQQCKAYIILVFCLTLFQMFGSNYKKSNLRSPSSVMPPKESRDYGSNCPVIKNTKSRRLNIQNPKTVKVVVLDIGFDHENPCLTKNFVNNYEVFLTESIKNSKVGWHGSHISSVISGINPNVEIVPVEYVKDDMLSYLNALEMAINIPGVKIINASLNGALYSKREQKLMEYAHKKGIHFIAASGNSGQNIDLPNLNSYPAELDLPNILTVGALTQRGFLWHSSNYGKRSVDILASGTYFDGYSKNRTIEKASGTSIAAAYITGLISLAMSKGKSIEESIDLVKRSATSGKYSKYGNFSEFTYASNISQI